MDALAAAAAVVAIATDANAPDDSGQRDICATVGVGDVDMADDASMAEDKENNDVHTAAGEIEDAASKVAIAPRMLCQLDLCPLYCRVLFATAHTHV